MEMKYERANPMQKWRRLNAARIRAHVETLKRDEEILPPSLNPHLKATKKGVRLSHYGPKN